VQDAGADDDDEDDSSQVGVQVAAPTLAGSVRLVIRDSDGLDGQRVELLAPGCHPRLEL
jgi:hypothetical protein